MAVRPMRKPASEHRLLSPQNPKHMPLFTGSTVGVKPAGDHTCCSACSLLACCYCSHVQVFLTWQWLNPCSRREGYNFSDAEQDEAIKLLDKNGDKLIQFNEFVDWWVNEVSQLSDVSASHHCQKGSEHYHHTLCKRSRTLAGKCDFLRC